jgi:hypothetical protein
VAIRPEFADVGFNYVDSRSMATNIFPQAEFIFSEMGSATPILTQSNGSKSLDPVDIFDISILNPALDACGVTDGRFGSANGMGFAILDINITSSGFYQRVEIDLSSIDFSITLTISDSLGISDGYYCSINKSTKLLTFGSISADGSVLTEIKSILVDISTVAATQDLIFQFDGSDRYKVTWGSYQILVSDSQNQIFSDDIGHIPGIIVTGECVSNYDVGAAQGFNIVDKGDYPTVNDVDVIIPSGIDRGMSYGVLSVDSNIWTSGYSSTGNYLSQSFYSATYDFVKANVGTAINIEECPDVILERNFPGSIAYNNFAVRTGFSSIVNNVSKINSIATKNVGIQNFLIELDPGATPSVPYVISDIPTLGQDAIDEDALPIFIIFVNDWSEGSPQVHDSDFRDIIDNIDSLTGPAWVCIAPNPKSFIDGSTYTILGWLGLQERFKYKLDEAIAEATPVGLNIGFICTHSLSDFGGNDPINLMIDDANYNARYWDLVFISIDVYDNAEFYIPYLEPVRAWALDKYMELGISISINCSAATPPLSSDIVDWLNSFYNYCINSEIDGYGSKVIAFSYSEKSEETVIPDPSDELTEFASLVSNSNSILDSGGNQIRTANLIPDFSRLDNFALAAGVAAVFGSASKVFIWNDLLGFQSSPSHNINTYITMFNALADQIHNFPGIQVYGPNIKLMARYSGSDAFYNGVRMDSRDIEALETFINGIEAATPTVFADAIAIQGNFTAAEWPDVIDYVKTLTTLPLAITKIHNSETDKINAILDTLGSSDIVVVDGDLFLNLDIFEFTGATWSYTATLVVPDQAINSKIRFTYSEDILYNGAVSITKNDATPYSNTFDLPLSGDTKNLGNLNEGTYTINIYGDTLQSGSATLRVWFDSDNFDEKTISDTKYVED